MELKIVTNSVHLVICSSGFPTLHLPVINSKVKYVNIIIIQPTVKNKLRSQSQINMIIMQPSFFFIDKLHLYELNLKTKYCLFVLRFYSPVNTLGSCKVQSVYQTTLFPKLA